MTVHVTLEKARWLFVVPYWKWELRVDHENGVKQFASGRCLRGITVAKGLIWAANRFDPSGGAVEAIATILCDPAK